MLTKYVPSQGTLGFNGNIISQWENVPSNKISTAAGLVNMIVDSGRGARKARMPLIHTYTVDEINFNLLKLF